MTRPNFQRALKKGEIGEQIIKQYLEGNGWVVYQPTTDGAHCFDMLSIKDKKTAIALDVKAKARLNFLPATGIDQRHFEEYKLFSNKHLMPFWVVFVDEMQKSIYGQEIAELEKKRIVDGVEYPKLISKGRIRIWPLIAMKDIASLDDKQIEQLKEHNQRNYKYEVA